MTGPTWLAAVIAVVMVASAVVVAVRIIGAWRSHRTNDYAIDIHNLLMGVSMAGVLLPGVLIVTPGPSMITWLMVWILVTVWFAISVARGAVQGTHGHRFTGHHTPQLVISGAMVYMFAVLQVSAGGSGDSDLSGPTAGGGLVPLATLDYGLVIFMIGYAVLVVDRLPALAATRSSELSDLGRRSADTPSRPFAPTTGGVITILMALTMGYMLTMLFA